MSRSRVGWMFGAVAPWCLGVGLAVSVPADAGVDSSIGASLAPDMFTPRFDAPDDLVPASTGRMHLAHSGGGLPLVLARLSIGEPLDFLDRAPAEHEPRRDLKPKASSFPVANTAAKGDPFVGLRPTFDARLRANGVEGYRQAMLVSSRRYLAFETLQDSGDPGRQMEAAQRLTQDALPEGGTARSARPGRTGLSPRAPVQGLVAGARRSFDGSTPRVARAMAMASATPAPFDERLQVVYAPAIVVEEEKTPEDSRALAEQGGERPDYASLIDQSSAAREQRCLAEAIYFEARSEPEAGQAAVAQVVLNRVKSRLYPSSICGVVYQNRHRYLACQFTFACEGKSLRITEPEPWKTAVRIASEVLEGKTFLADVGGSTHYHANYVRPRWAKRLKKMDTIGSHIFYKLRPGQT
jgi:spore germination cell wall hydrolase CwlJ-like protein